ncbi:MAG: DUF5317 family protein [Eubacterium sp.]|nr:DUF5317 family protein [Eubacterium sp.]
MFVLIAVIVGLIIGFIRGGSLKGLGARKISLLPLGIIGALMQLALHLYYYTGGMASIEGFLPVINFISYILILITLVFNLDDFWTIMLTVGIIADFIITFLSGGKMPVAQAVMDMMPAGAFATSVSDGSNALYVIMDTSILRLWFLGINLPIPALGGITQLVGSVSGVSVGGILSLVGLLGWIQYAMNRSTRKDFTKDDMVEDLDYIIPPEDETDIFDDEETSEGLFDETEDFYDEEDFYDDEDGMTARIPQLTPEAIASFQSNSSALGMPAAELQDSKEDTKVFTAIRDLGTFESHEDVAKEEEETPVSGFFTQSFYAEKEKGKLAFDSTDIAKKEIHEESEEKGQEAPVVIEPSKTEASETPAAAPKAQEVPFTVQDNTIVTQEKPKAPVYGKPMTESKKSERTEEEMRNIWQQVNQENEKIRARKRRRVHYADVREPFKAEREKTAARKAVARAATGIYTGANPEVQPVYREITPPQPEVVQTKPVHTPVTIAEEIRTERTVTETVQPTPAEVKESTAVFTIPNLAPEPAKETVTETPEPEAEAPAPKKAAAVGLSDDDREKAGYERVTLNIDGEEVSFWKKKKELQ